MLITILIREVQIYSLYEGIYKGIFPETYSLERYSSEDSLDSKDYIEINQWQLNKILYWPLTFDRFNHWMK